MANAGQFKKGHKGGPGRPPAIPPEIKAACREHTIEAIKTLVSVMRSDKENGSARVAAANSILDRGWGKAAQPLTGEDGAPLVIQVIQYGGDGDAPASV